MIPREQGWDIPAAKNNPFLEPTGASYYFALVTILFIAVFIYLGIWSLSPPRAVPASMPPTEFSSERAMNHIRVIAKKPRPIGSAEHAMTRSYILNELNAQGLVTDVQERTVLDSSQRPYKDAATIHNVVGKLTGNNNIKAVLLSANYDSAPNSPGANNNASGVAALL